MRSAAFILLGLVTAGCPASPADVDVDTDTDGVDTDTDVADTDTDVVDTDTVDTDMADTDGVDTDTDADTDTDTVDTDPVDPCSVSPAVVSVGTGGRFFEPLVDGQVIEIYHGIQGGWHYWIGVDVAYTTDEFVRVAYTVTDVATGIQPILVPDSPPIVQLVGDTPGVWTCQGTAFGIQAILDFTLMGGAFDDWSPLCGTELEISVVVSSMDGSRTIGSDTIRLISQPYPGDGPYCVP